MSSVLMGAFFGAVAGGLDEFAAGTVMIFRNSNAPTGWTKKTSFNNIALRSVANASVGGNNLTGGNTNFNSIFASSRNTNSTTITTPYTGNHGHGFPTIAAGTNLGNRTFPVTGLNPNAGAAGSTTAGSSGSHSHSLAMDLKYADVIIATKDA